MFNRYNINDFGNRLKIIRKARKISQDKLADNIPITRGSVIAWEKDNNSRIPSVETMIRLCEVLDCDLDYLLGRCDTYHRETAEISETTGLSPAAANTLRMWKNDSDKPGPKGMNYDKDHAILAINTLSSLLECNEGKTVLTQIGLYLHGKISRTLPRGECEQMEHDLFKHFLNTNASAEEIIAEYQALEDELDREKKTVNFIIEDLDMPLSLDIEEVKIMVLSWIQKALINLKDKIDTAKGKKGGAEDGNGEKAR